MQPMWLCLCWSFDEKTFTNTSQGVSMMSMTVMHNIRIRYSGEQGWYLRRCFILDRQLRTQLVLGGSRLESVKYFLLEVALLPKPPWLLDWQRCVRDKAAFILNPHSTYSMVSLLVEEGEWEPGKWKQFVWLKRCLHYLHVGRSVGWWGRPL